MASLALVGCFVGACGGEAPSKRDPWPDFRPVASKPPVKPDPPMERGWLREDGPDLQGHRWGMRCSERKGWTNVTHTGEFSARSELTLWRRRNERLELGPDVPIASVEWICRDDRLVRVQLRLESPCAGAGAAIEGALGPALFGDHIAGERFFWDTPRGLVQQDLMVLSGGETSAHVWFYDTQHRVAAALRDCERRDPLWQPSCVQWALFAFHGVGMPRDPDAAGAAIRTACDEGGFRCNLVPLIDRGEVPRGPPSPEERNHACAPPSPPQRGE